MSLPKPWELISSMHMIKLLDIELNAVLATLPLISVDQIRLIKYGMSL